MLLTVLVRGAATVRRDQVARLLARLARSEGSPDPKGACHERCASLNPGCVHVERKTGGENR